MKREIVLGVGLAAALATAAFVRPPRAAPAFTMVSAPATPSAAHANEEERNNAGPRRGKRPGRPHRYGERSERKRAKSNHAPSTRRPRIEPLDVNRADVLQLSRVPGVSDDLARRIVAYRDLVGRLQSLDDLSDLDGLSESRLASLSRYLVVR